MLSLVYLALLVAAPVGATPSCESSSGESCHVDSSHGDVANLLQYPIHIHDMPSTDILDTQVDQEASEANPGMNASSLELDSCLLPVGARWCRARSGDKTWEMAVYSQAQDPFVSGNICGNGFWEFSDPAAMGINMTMLQGEQMVLLDIGAHIGWYSLMFAAHGHKAIAVEPMTANRALLKATLCKNPDLASRIHVFAAALTDMASPGAECSIYSDVHNTGDGVLACTPTEVMNLEEQEYIEHEKVPLTTFNRLVEQSRDVIGKRIDAMKLDVEGYECHVLAGASSLFQYFDPRYLMIEARPYKSNVGETFTCIHQNILSHGPYAMRFTSFSGQVYTVPEAENTFNELVNVFFAK